jgi:hypothetical protein
MYDVEAVRQDFPILGREIHGRPLIYLDNGASAQKPRAVIDVVTEMYAMDYANVHRGLHYLSTVATEKYEATRGIVQRFLGAKHEEEIVFTTGSTMGINMVSYAWAAPRFEAGDGRSERRELRGAQRPARPYPSIRAADRGTDRGDRASSGERPRPESRGVPRWGCSCAKPPCE